jgi:hypothetical protein
VTAIVRDRRVGSRFWKLETASRRYSVRVHFWLHRANWVRLNRQPSFTEVMLFRCLDFTVARLRSPEISR